MRGGILDVKPEIDTASVQIEQKHFFCEFFYFWKEKDQSK